MIFKKLFLFILVSFFSLVSYSQQDTVKHKTDKNQQEPTSNFVFGGNFGLEIGSITFIDLSPIAGYYLKPSLLLGIGSSFQYINETYFFSNNSVKVSSKIYGLRSFVNYTFFENLGKTMMVRQNFGLFAHLEYEALNLDHDFSNTKTSQKINRFWLNGILVGGGIKQFVGKRSSFNIAVLYNILATRKTPYDNPLIRIGFLF